MNNEVQKMTYHDYELLKDEIQTGDIINDRYLIVGNRVERRFHSVSLQIFDLYTGKNTIILLNDLPDFIRKRFKKTFYVEVRNCQDIINIDYT